MSKEKYPLKVFLCHSKADKQKVHELYRYLVRRRIKPWFDEIDLVGGQDWQIEIPKALATSDAILICLTKNSVDKEGYIQKEIRFALDKALEMPEGRIFLVPVRFEDCEVPFALSRYQWVDLFDETGYTKMMRALKLRASQLERSAVEWSSMTVAEEEHVLEEVVREEESKVVGKVENGKTGHEVNEKVSREKVKPEPVKGPKIVEKEPARKSDQLVVEMKGIVKRFPGVLANDHVDFELRAGEIHALLGENGAGKSTLMNVLAGLYRQDAGIIKVKGKTLEFSSPRDAIKAGIGMVHQHFMLVPSQTVTENILLGLDDPRFLMRLNEYDKKIADLGDKFGLKVDPRAKIWQLSVGEQQRVELLKMLYRGADVLIMDEPTAVLAPQEIDVLFDTLRSMVTQGKSIIFISHKLQEVTAIADRVSVLRRGRATASGVPAKGVTKQELASMMVGREVVLFVDKKPKEPGKTILDVKNVQAENDKGLPALRGLSLNIRAGEIVGIAGVAGNGQIELSQVIAGLRKCKQGEVTLNGEKVSNRDTLYGIEHGMSYVPEDRTHVGSSPNLSVTDNVIMKNYRKPPISKGSMLDMNAATKFAKELKEAYDIIVPTVNTPVRLLSGGNLQRVILAREISGHPNFMVAVQPTRGLDVGAIEGVHRLLLTQREADAAVLLISEELEELLALSDRVYVIYEGKIMGEVKVGGGEPDEKLVEAIGLMMTGTPLDQIHREGVAANG